LLWIAGLLVAATITIWDAFYVVDHFIAQHDPTEPLASKGGLDRQHGIGGKWKPRIDVPLKD
jgi:hypothetical protein